MLFSLSLHGTARLFSFSSLKFSDSLLTRPWAVTVCYVCRLYVGHVCLLQDNIFLSKFNYGKRACITKVMHPCVKDLKLNQTNVWHKTYATWEIRLIAVIYFATFCCCYFSCVMESHISQWDNRNAFQTSHSTQCTINISHQHNLRMCR